MREEDLVNLKRMAKRPIDMECPDSSIDTSSFTHSLARLTAHALRRCKAYISRCTACSQGSAGTRRLRGIALCSGTAESQPEASSINGLHSPCKLQVCLREHDGRASMLGPA